MLQEPLIDQIRKRLNEIDFEVNTNFNYERAHTLAIIQDILEKRQINSDYPSLDITEEDIWSLSVKNL